MKVLFIGGTGNISTAVSKLAIEKGIELFHLNRGKRKVEIKGVKTITADISNEKIAYKALIDYRWDVVVNWIAYKPADIERDIRLFTGKTSQYIFISSASVYQKPPAHPIITESTPLCNPFWDYSRDKIACEELLNCEFRKNGFPITIVRPSLTYDTVIPLAIGGWTDYGIIKRMKAGKPVVVHGDGTSLWTVTHSEDFAKGFVGLLGHQQSIGHAFHITSDEVLTWNQIYEVTAEATGAKANIIHISSDFIIEFGKACGWGWMEGNLIGDKAISTIFDNSKIKRFVPNFQATISYKVGIKRTLDWFEASPERMQTDLGADKFLDDLMKAYKGKVAKNLKFII